MTKKVGQMKMTTERHENTKKNASQRSQSKMTKKLKMTTERNGQIKKETDRLKRTMLRVMK